MFGFGRKSDNFDAQGDIPRIERDGDQFRVKQTDRSGNDNDYGKFRSIERAGKFIDKGCAKLDQ